MVGPLPSKQICAGSSPVSRSNNIGVMDKCLTPIYAGCLMQKPKPMPWERRWRRDGPSPSPGLKILPIIIMCRCSLVDRAATQYWVVVTGSSPVGGQGVWRFRQKPRNHLAPCGRLEMCPSAMRRKGGGGGADDAGVEIAPKATEHFTLV